ncbi:MAG: FkbM family methyltransferase [Bacteroidota bacterium]
MGYSNTLGRLIKNHSFSGFVAFVRIKIGITKNIGLNTLKHRFSLRANTSDVTTFKHIFAHDDYNFHLLQDPGVIIDAGANIGLASIYFANKYANAEIISIELSPSNFQLLKKNTEKYSQVNCINAGVWHKNQTLKFIEEGFSPWGYKVNNKLDENSISVKSITILDIIEQYNLSQVDLLKVDIEGAEVELFSENYGQWLPKVKYLVIEFHDRSRPDSSKTVKKALSEFDFVELDSVGENAVFFNKNLG